MKEQCPLLKQEITAFIELVSEYAFRANDHEGYKDELITYLFSRSLQFSKKDETKIMENVRNIKILWKLRKGSGTDL